MSLNFLHVECPKCHTDMVAFYSGETRDYWAECGNCGKRFEGDKNEDGTQLMLREQRIH